MEAKEKVIAEKWIEAIGEENFKEVTLDADGVGSIPMELYYDNLGKFKLVTAYITTMIVIPKSLVGISNNNGWIRIESEKDLPKIAEGLQDTYILGLLSADGKFNQGNKDVFTDRVHELYKKKKITHYRLYTEFEPPLF